MPSGGVAALGAVEVGNPGGWAVPGHHLGDDTRTTAAADHVHHHLGVLEHPVPAGAAVNAPTGLARAEDAAPAETGQDGGGFGVQAGLAAPERRIQRAFADAEAEQLEQQAAQPPVTDVVGEAQVHRQRDDVAAERRTTTHQVRLLNDTTQQETS